MCTSYRVLKNQGLKFLTHHQMTISYKVNGSLDVIAIDIYAYRVEFLYICKSYKSQLDTIIFNKSASVGTLVTARKSLQQSKCNFFLTQQFTISHKVNGSLDLFRAFDSINHLILLSKLLSQSPVGCCRASSWTGITKHLKSWPTLGY